jgi:hypothetical protein
MKKQLEYGLKAEKRALKKRPRMKLHGQALKRPSKFAGLAAIKNKKAS